MTQAGPRLPGEGKFHHGPSSFSDFAKPSVWASKAILNVARSGRFSSDRTVKEYAREIWDIHRAV